MNLRYYSFLLGLILLSQATFAQNNIGEIVFLKSGTYQIDYPNQLINVYFNNRPGGDFETLVTGLDTSEDEKYVIVHQLKTVIDGLPEDFVSKFLSVDIFPLHILSETTYGYYYENQIVIEISKAKRAMASDGSIESNFLHEVAHRIYERMESRNETTSFVNYLAQFQKQYPCLSYSNDNELFKSGYISAYASGKLTGAYKPNEEFAELFANIIWENSRNEVLDYTKQFPESIMAEKTSRFIAYLEEIIPSLNRDFLNINTANQTNAYASIQKDEINILDLHELKSNTSSALSQSDEFANDEVKDSKNTKVDYPVSEQIDETANFKYSTNTAPGYTSVFTPVASTSNTTKHKQKKIKKEKGKNHKGESWGLAIFGIAIGIAAEFLL